MGMTNMFNDEATFDELLEEKQPLKISDVVHKAFIEVNEEGAEAAAATGNAHIWAWWCSLHFVRHFRLFFCVSGSGLSIFVCGLS